MPAIMEPTNHKTDVCNKKKPTPTPKSVVPPIAQVLLSLLINAIIFKLTKGQIYNKSQIITMTYISCNILKLIFLK